MKFVFTKKHFDEMIKKYSGKAKELIADKEKFEAFTGTLERKLKKIPKVGDDLANIPALVSLVRAYVTKEYKAVPLASIMAAVCVLLYFVAPLDLIPDSIPAIGFADDAAAFAFVWKMIKDDIADYKKWQTKANS